MGRFLIALIIAWLGAVLTFILTGSLAQVVAVFVGCGFMVLLVLLFFRNL